ncbi:hypothetical protein D3C71_1190770 [compost metagenome]
MLQVGHVPVVVDAFVHVPPKLVAQRGLVGRIEHIDAEPGSADGIHFLHQQIAPFSHALRGAGKRKGDQQAQQGEYRRLDGRRARAAIFVRLVAVAQIASEPDRAQQKQKERGGAQRQNP